MYKRQIQGIGAGFIPATLDSGIYDEIMPVADEDAFATGRAVARSEGILAVSYTHLDVYKRQIYLWSKIS